MQVKSQSENERDLSSSLSGSLPAQPLVHTTNAQALKHELFVLVLVHNMNLK